MELNEWKQACHRGERYWLYAVFDCTMSASQLLRVQDPFAKLLAICRATAGSGAGAVRIVEDRIVLAAID